MIDVGVDTILPTPAPMELLVRVRLFKNEFDATLFGVDVVVVVIVVEFAVSSLFCNMLLVLIMTTCGRFIIGESICVLIWLAVVAARLGAETLVVGFRTVDN